nr:hypothetical protein [Tanacetum cinerariifolium]
MTKKTALDTTIASAGGKLRRRSIPAMRNTKPNLLTKIVKKVFSFVFGNRKKPSETNEEPVPVPREEGQRATPMVTFASRVLEEEEEIASYVAPVVEPAKAYRPSKVARRQDLVLHNNATKIAPKIATPRSRGRSALYRMARTSYARTSSARLEPPVKLPAEPPRKKRALRTSVPGSDSTAAVAEPPQKKCKCAFQMSAPSFEIDDALAADIVATSILPGVSLTTRRATRHTHGHIKSK